MDLDLQFYIVHIVRSSIAFLCKDLAKLRLVCKSLSIIITLSDLEKKVLDEKLFYLHCQRYKGTGYLFYLPIDNVKMMLPIQISPSGNITLFRFKGPLQKNLTHLRVLDECMKTLSGLYKFDTKIENIFIYVNLQSWELFQVPYWGRFSLCRPGETCSSSGYGFLHGKEYFKVALWNLIDNLKS
jgi:hypothetical protein